MDTKKDSAVSDVPTFKVARVGKDRKRKGGAFSFLRGGGGRGGFSGATGGAGAGGSGAAGMFASSAAKTALSLMLASGIGAAAVGAGYMGLFGGDAQKPVKKPEVFSSKEAVKIEGDTSNLPSNSNSIPNSMGYVTGSKDGLTPEERAAKQAAEEAEAARLAAEDEAKRKAEEEAAAKSGAVDPNALLASAQQDGGKNDKGNGFGKKFGQLSSSTGGSALAGGAGMAGGVGRSFGGMGSIGKGSNGKLGGAGTTARPTMKAASSAKVAKSNVKGFARQQLANANALSRRGMSASRGESAAYDASSAFDNNQGAGTVISGAGIGNGTGSGGGADTTANPNTTSQPVGQLQAECGKDEAVDGNGGCRKIETPKDKDATKHAWMYKVAQAILAAIVVLTALWWLGAGTAWALGSGAALMEACVVAIALLALAMTALGVAMILATGDKMAGGIFTLVGVWILFGVNIGGSTAASTTALGILVPAILGGFAAAGAKKPEAAGQ